MCRSITALRGLDPPASAEEITDAARQFVGKVGALTSAQRDRPEARRAIEEIAAVVTTLLAELPARRQAPRTVPPGRRLTARESS